MGFLFNTQRITKDEMSNFGFKQKLGVNKEVVCLSPNKVRSFERENGGMPLCVIIDTK